MWFIKINDVVTININIYVLHIYNIYEIFNKCRLQKYAGQKVGSDDIPVETTPSNPSNTQNTEAVQAKLAPNQQPKLKLTNPRVYLDITIGGVAAGRIVIELRADVVPSKLNITSNRKLLINQFS